MPMLVTLLGIFIDVRLEQFAKAPSPILVTLLGIVTDMRSEHHSKVDWPMLVTLYVFPPYVTEEGIMTSPEYPRSDDVLYVIVTLVPSVFLL